MEERGIRRLQKSIAECKKLKFAPPELAQAQQFLAQLEVRLACSLTCVAACVEENESPALFPLTSFQAALASLQSATNEGSIPKLQKSIAECKKLKFAPRELAQAEQLLPQLEVRLFPCSCRYLAWWSLSRSLSLAFPPLLALLLHAWSRFGCFGRLSRQRLRV